MFSSSLQNDLQICPRPTLTKQVQPDGCAVCAILAESLPSENELPQENITVPSIDSHIHCGQMYSNTPYEEIRTELLRNKIVGACLFSPVNEIYDRNNSKFYDTEDYQISRQKSNHYLLEVAAKYPGEVYPFYFVWNDFNKDELEHYKGVKWHRHPEEPKYDYKSAKCEEFLQKVYQYRLPIILEEETENTLEFIMRVAGRTDIIIPHLGMLNGGYGTVKRLGIWNQPNVYADCSLAFTNVTDFISQYGSEKLFFGSDYPFGKPGSSKRFLYKIYQEGRMTKEDFHNICYNNIKNLLHI